MVRECTNQVLRFDPDTKVISHVKTYGISVNTRKSHTAVAYRNQMIVYGGCSENDQIFQDMLTFNLDSHEWSSVRLCGVNVPSVTQGAACTVTVQESTHDHNKQKVS